MLPDPLDKLPSHFFAEFPSSPFAFGYELLAENTVLNREIMRVVIDYCTKGRELLCQLGLDLMLSIPFVAFCELHRLDWLACSGINSSGEPFLVMNKEALELPLSEFKDTVGHEIAHILSFLIFGKGNILEHGIEWRAIAAFMGVEPKTRPCDHVHLIDLNYYFYKEVPTKKIIVSKRKLNKTQDLVLLKHVMYN